jgi:hypothetical protein
MHQDATSDKRESKRSPVQLSVILVIDGSETEYRATTVDVSPHGVRLLSDATLVLNQRVSLHLRAEPEHFVKARVVWFGNHDPAQGRQAGFEFLNLPRV